MPEGVYPKEVDEYLLWDDCKVLQLMKDNVNRSDACKNIIERIVYPQVFYTKTHPTEADKREFKRNKREIIQLVGEQYVLVDNSAGKMPHKIPNRVEIDDEKAIIIYDEKIGRKTTILEESEIISNLAVKIDIQRIYCHPDKSDKARDLMKSVNEE